MTQHSPISKDGSPGGEIDYVAFIDLLNQQSFELRHINTQQSLELAQKAHGFALEHRYRKGEGNALLNTGFHEQVVSKYREAFSNYSAAMKIFKAIEDQPGVAHTHYNIGLVYLRLGDYDAAMEMQQESIRIRIELNDEAGIASCKSQIGYLNSQFGLDEAALNEYIDCLSTWRKLNYRAGIGNILMAMGTLMTKMDRLEKAKEYLLESMHVRQELNEVNGVHGSANYLSAVYLKEGNYQAALDLLEPALAEALVQEHPFVIGISRLRLSLAKVYAAKNDFTAASDQLEKALSSAKLSGQEYQLHDIYFELSGLYKSIGEYDKALTYYEKFHASKEAIINLNAATKLKNIEVMNTVKLREREIELQQQKNLELKERNRVIRLERKKSDSLLLNILPAQTAKELKRSGHTTPRQYDQVSVFFSDFVNFTLAAEKLDPSQLVHRIDSFFRAFDDIISKYNIEKIKTIGDSYMAAAGIPEPGLTDAADLVAAAIEIMDYVTDVNDPFFKIRIGIHTGPLVAGVVGSKKFAYDIWGDTVNTASRMESSGVAGQINISGTTYDLVRDKWTCKYRGKVQAKNKGEIDMYFVQTVPIR